MHCMLDIVESPLFLFNVSAFKGPLLNEALLLQYDNFLGGPLVYINLEMVPALLLPGTCALAGQTAAHVV